MSIAVVKITKIATIASASLLLASSVFAQTLVPSREAMPNANPIKPGELAAGAVAQAAKISGLSCEVRVDGDFAGFTLVNSSNGTVPAGTSVTYTATGPKNARQTATFTTKAAMPPKGVEGMRQGLEPGQFTSCAID